jgi:hypothetical protein
MQDSHEDLFAAWMAAEEAVQDATRRMLAESQGRGAEAGSPIERRLNCFARKLRPNTRC